MTARLNEGAHFDFSSSPFIKTFSVHTHSVRGLSCWHVSDSSFPPLLMLLLCFYLSWHEIRPVLCGILYIHQIKDVSTFMWPDVSMQLQLGKLMTQERLELDTFSGDRAMRAAGHSVGTSYASGPGISFNSQDSPTF